MTRRLLRTACEKPCRMVSASLVCESSRHHRALDLGHIRRYRTGRRGRVYSCAIRRHARGRTSGAMAVAQMKVQHRSGPIETAPRSGQQSHSKHFATARRVVVLPATASQPLSLSALKATLVLRTVTLNFASQSLTCLSTANLCVPVKVLTFMGSSQKEPRHGPPEL
jgi:hypothetical protein